MRTTASHETHMIQPASIPIFEQTFQSDPSKRKDIIDLLCKVIIERMIPLSLSAEELYLILDEAITNAIEHGNKWDPSKSIHVRVETQDKRVTVRIRDEGEGFNHRGLKLNTKKRDIMSKRGRGIYIISQFSDISWNERGNEIILTIPRKNRHS